uniref:Putative sterile alpha motif protein n=1 Tax=Culex tarsalis TaxID=7177 RepID=A0A1Q3F1R9_CULTA
MVKNKSGGEVENGGGGDKSAEATANPGTSSGGTGPPSDGDNISTRVGARTKKAKVVFDPSDNYVPRKRVRKSDLAAEIAAVIGASPPSAKTEQVPPKSPAKLEKPVQESNNGSNAAIKPRLTQSPVALAKPKVLGSGPSSSTSSSALDGVGRVATSTPTSPVRNCDMCHKVEQLRRGFKLIDCSICAFRAHSKCLRAHPMYSKFPIQLNFRCFQCIECVVCGKSLRGGKLLFCCDCQNAFHQNCHGPPESAESGTSSSRSWVCKQCSPRPEKNRSQSSDHDQDEEEEEAPAKEAPAVAPAAPGDEHFAGFSDNEIRKDSLSLSDGATANESNDLAASIKEEVDVDHVAENGIATERKQQLDPRLDSFENVQNWTCDDVYRYFKHHFPDYAHLFREQEIDGPSLVLMRKSDVLSGFGLKLGPAITLYQRIVMMQNNDPDFRLTWI